MPVNCYSCCLRKTTPEVPVTFTSGELIVVNKPEGNCPEMSSELHKLYLCGDFSIPVAACKMFEIRDGILMPFSMPGYSAIIFF
jgi:hypothetical protein